MAIDMAQKLYKGFPSESEPARSRCLARAWDETEAKKLKSTVECVVARAIADAGSSLCLGENVGLAVVSLRDLANYTLHPEEVRILAPRASPKRQLEFALGRAAANFALRQLGFENPAPVLRGPNGEPLWRDGIVGSITHCYPWAAAVAITCSKRLTIGVDLETTEAIDGTDISHLVCCEAELDWVRHGNFQERLTMIFSAKEAVYKAFSPLCRRYIDFKEVSLTWFPEQYRLQCEFLGRFFPNLPWGRSCAVHYLCHVEMVFSCVIHPLPLQRHT